MPAPIRLASLGSTVAHVVVAYLVFVILLAAPAAAQDVVVSPDGPVTTVAEGVAQAERGGRVVVMPGLYREPTVVVDKPVTIVGEGWPVLDGEEERQLLTITGDSVTVTGLVLRNVGTTFSEDRAAIKLDEASHCVIAGNRLENAFFGIYLAKTAHCRIEDNLIVGEETRQTAAGNGIHLWYSRWITITDNTIRGHRDGIYLEFVEDSEVLRNTATENLRYGLHFMFSDRCAYRHNTFARNNAGVAVMYTENVEMTDNRFLHNWGPAAFGLLLKDITDSRVERNVFDRNTVAVYAEGSNRVHVADNHFTANGWAVKIMANAEDNVFTRNTFVGNSFDVATNSRSHYSTFDGNYWDAYQGYDLDRDGVGDVPFRPVRLFTLLVERNEPSLLLMRSFFVSLLDAAERVLPALTPETLVDQNPLMRPLP